MNSAAQYKPSEKNAPLPPPNSVAADRVGRPRQLFFGLLMGVYFGIVLTKSQVISWFKIRNMFYFREPDLYLIIGSAVAVGALSVFLLRRFGAKNLAGEPIDLPKKPYSQGLFFGGAIFGIGWFVTGTCPGPIFTQIGSGEYFAFFTLAGALLGTYGYGAMQKRLPH